MPSRNEYLVAVGANPRSTAERIYALVKQCPTVAAADTMLRKLASKGLLTTESTSPRRYSLTDWGKAELSSFADSPVESHARASSDLPVDQIAHLPMLNRVQRVRALLERLTALQANGSENSGRPSEEQSPDEIKPGVLELLAFERALSDLPRRDLQKHRQSLCEQIGNEAIVERIARLAKAEAELHQQKGWWGDASEARRLDSEIAELKHQLGLSEVAVRAEE